MAWCHHRLLASGVNVVDLARRRVAWGREGGGEGVACRGRRSSSFIPSSWRLSSSYAVGALVLEVAEDVAEDAAGRGNFSLILRLVCSLKQAAGQSPSRDAKIFRARRTHGNLPSDCSFEAMRADGRERGTRLTDEHNLTQAAPRCNAATSASYFAMAWDTTCSSANATSPGEDSSSGSVRDDA